MTKSISFFIFLSIACGVKSFCQIVKDTTYFSKNNSNYEITLFNNNKYERTIYNSYCGVGYYSTGTYSTNSDTLILAYKEADFKGPFIKEQIVTTEKVVDSTQGINIEISHINNQIQSDFTVSIDDEFHIIHQNKLSLTQKKKKSILKVYNYVYEEIYEIQLLENLTYKIEFFLEEREVEVKDRYRIIKAKSGDLILKNEFGKKIKLSLKTL